MTHTTEILVNVALVTLILVNVVAGVVLIKKTFGGRLGYRFKDRVWSTLDDHGERLAIVESSLEALDPEGKRDYAGGQRTQLIRDIRILIDFEAEIGNSALFKRILAALDAQDPDPDFRDFEAGHPVHGFK